MLTREQSQEVAQMFLHDAETSRGIDGQKGYAFNLLASTNTVIVWDYDRMNQMPTFDWLQGIADSQNVSATSLEIGQVAIELDAMVRSQQRELISG